MKRYYLWKMLFAVCLMLIVCGCGGKATSLEGKVVDGKGGLDQLEFAQTTARYVRIYATVRGVRGDDKGEEGIKSWQGSCQLYGFKLAKEYLENREGPGLQRDGRGREGYEIMNLGVFEK